MKKALSTLIAISTISTALAVELTQPSVPKNLHVYNQAGNTYVDMTASGCSNYRYSLDPNHKKYDAIYSGLLAAQMADKKIVIRFDGCNGSGQGNIIGFYLK